MSRPSRVTKFMSKALVSPEDLSRYRSTTRRDRNIDDEEHHDGTEREERQGGAAEETFDASRVSRRRVLSLPFRRMFGH